MTDEELNSVEQTTALLVENGFVIKDITSFINENGSENLEEVVNKLASLQESINKGVNAEDFSKDIAVSLDEIQDVVNNNAEFKNSLEAANFENLLNNLRNESSRLCQNTLKAEEVLRNREDNFKDILNRISKLKLDKSIDDVTRTRETIRLTFALEHCKVEKKRALDFYNEQKAISEKPLLADDILGLKNGLLKAVNALDDSFRKLSLSPDVMDSLAESIRVARDKIVLFGFETQKNKKDFEEICKKYGLEQVDNKTIEKVEVKENVQDDVLELEENNNHKNITGVSELLSEIKKLNPDVQVVNENGVDELLVKDVNKLVLPEGFHYDENLGINNKVNDFTPYISSFVKAEEKGLDTEKTDVKDDTLDAQVNQDEKREELKGKSKIPSGRLSIKRTRRAIVAPYIKACLCYGGLGCIVVAAAGLGLSALGTGLIVGAGIGSIGQKIYNKLVDKGVLGADFKNVEDPSFELPLFGAHIIKDARALLSGLQKYKAKKKKEALEEKPAVEEVKAPEMESSPAVPELNEVPIQSNIIEENVPVQEPVKEPEDKLYDNFKDMLSSNLNEQVDSLENNNMEMGNGVIPGLPIEEYALNPSENLGYLEDGMSRGGR